MIPCWRLATESVGLLESAASGSGPPPRRSGAGYTRRRNVLNKLPKKLQPNAKSGLWEILSSGGLKPMRIKPSIASSKPIRPSIPKRVSAWIKTETSCLHSMTFQPSTGSIFVHRILSESTFSTVRLRTKKTRGALSKTTVTPLVFKLVQSAQKAMATDPRL